MFNKSKLLYLSILLANVAIFAKLTEERLREVVTPAGQELLKRFERGEFKSCENGNFSSVEQSRCEKEVRRTSSSQWLGIFTKAGVAIAFSSGMFAVFYKRDFIAQKIGSAWNVLKAKYNRTTV